MIDIILLLIRIMAPGGNFDLHSGDGIRPRYRYRGDVGNPFDPWEYKSAHFPAIMNVFVRSESEGFDQEIRVAAISVQQKVLTEVQRRRSCSRFPEHIQRKTDQIKGWRSIFRPCKMLSLTHIQTNLNLHAGAGWTTGCSREKLHTVTRFGTRSGVKWRHQVAAALLSLYWFTC